MSYLLQAIVSSRTAHADFPLLFFGNWMTPYENTVKTWKQKKQENYKFEYSNVECCGQKIELDLLYFVVVI